MGWEAQLCAPCVSFSPFTAVTEVFPPFFLLQHFHSLHVRFSLEDGLPVLKVVLCHVLFILMHYKYINIYLD